MLLRDALGDTLRDARTSQNRTLRDVSTAANVSLGYLSEVERGRKEASSELLASICEALDLNLSDVLVTVSDTIRTGRAPAVRTRAASAEKVAANSDRRPSVPVGLDKNRIPTSVGASRQETRPRQQLRIVVPYEHPETPVR